jgi:hypothetical protein
MPMAREPHPMTDFPRERPRFAPQASPQDWLLAVATAELALLVIGMLPHVKW